MTRMEELTGSEAFVANALNKLLCKDLHRLAAVIEDEITDLEQAGETMESARDIVREAGDYALMFDRRGE